MKRHSALVPLSHDHHHGLVEARRLGRAADRPDQVGAAQAFLRFFADETLQHFRDEEELLFPLIANRPEARDQLVRVLLEHQQIHALVRRLSVQVNLAEVEPTLMRALADVLQEHIRFEERELFPLIEQLLTDAELSTGLDGRLHRAIVGRGPVWGGESEELNATVLEWSAGTGTPVHVNDERDVLVAVLAGTAIVTVDGHAHDLGPAEPILIAKGRARQITAGDDGVRYLSVHRRRGPLQVAPPRRTSG